MCLFFEGLYLEYVLLEVFVGGKGVCVLYVVDVVFVFEFVDGVLGGYVGYFEFMGKLWFIGEWEIFWVMFFEELVFECCFDERVFCYVCFW